MEMSFEKIEPEHPAIRAAKMIRELHVESIAKIDGGQLFLKDGVDVSAEMRAACAEQIAQCDKLIAVVDSDALTSMLPEFGNYDHEKT